MVLKSFLRQIYFFGGGGERDNKKSNFVLQLQKDL